MKFPRNVSGNELIKSLQKIGYPITRQKGSHVRLTCKLPQGDHHITVPFHDPLKIGTLSSIISDIAQAHQISKSDLTNKIFG